MASNPKSSPKGSPKARPSIVAVSKTSAPESTQVQQNFTDIPSSSREWWAQRWVDVLESLGAANIVTQNTPNLTLKGMLQAYQVNYLAEPLAYDAELANKITAKDLKRFSKYWAIVGSAILKSEAD